jgi:hypothetical protein
MPIHRDFEASIEVDGKALEEFGAKQDPENERSYVCWIPSEVGKVCPSSLFLL